MKQKWPFLLLIGFTLIIYLVSMFLCKSDIANSRQWPTFFLWLISVFLVLFSSVLLNLPKLSNITRKSIAGLILIVLIAFVSRFIFLTNYPYVSLGDELRDGGANAQEIQNGEIKNIFGYGRYEAHGLIIPTIALPFYQLFGSSVLVYRLPSALVSILDIVLFYMLLQLITGNFLASFSGTLVLIAMPLHLYYSRTQLVVILSSLLSTIILIYLYVFIKRRKTNLWDYAGFGTLIGFTFNFHASVKAFAIIILGAVLFLDIFHLTVKKQKIKNYLFQLSLLIVFVFVGFGPRLLSTPSWHMFFHTSRVPFISSNNQNTNPAKVKPLLDNYRKSLLVWFKEPTMAWYPDHKPIYSLPIFALMAIGILAAFINRNFYLLILIPVTLIIHLTNSALTDVINGDHRLAPLLPVGTLFVGYGIANLIKLIRFKVLYFSFILVLSAFLLRQSILFYKDRPADKNFNITEYLSMNTIYMLKKHSNYQKTNELTFTVSPLNYQNYNYRHYQEQFKYFFSNTKINLVQDQKLNDNEIFIKSGRADYLKKSILINCNGNNFRCPIGYTQNMIIHY